MATNIIGLGINWHGADDAEGDKDYIYSRRRTDD